jgi:hypothetical protein
MTRKYTWLKDLSSIYYGRKFSYVCGYTQNLDLTWVRKELFLAMLHSKT